MPDLSSQLRAYYEAATDPVDIESVVAATRPGLRLVDVVPDHHTVELPAADQAVADPPSGRPSQWLMAAAAAVVTIALGVGLFVAGTRVARAPEPANVPPTVAPTLPTIDEHGTIGAPADELGLAFRRLEPGRYRTGQLGVQVAFDVPEPMLLTSTRANVVVLSDGVDRDLEPFPSAQEWTPDVLVEIRMMRVAGWSTRDEAIDVAGDAASIDPDDIDAWIAANDVTVTNDETVRVAGRDARVIDIRVDPDSNVRASACWADYQPCFLAAAVTGEAGGFRTRPVWISAAVSQRITVVPIDGFEPLVIVIAAPVGSDQLDVLQDEVVESLTLGPDAAPIGGG